MECKPIKLCCSSFHPHKQPVLNRADAKGKILFNYMFVCFFFCFFFFFCNLKALFYSHTCKRPLVDLGYKTKGKRKNKSHVPQQRSLFSPQSSTTGLNMIFRNTKIQMEISAVFSFLSSISMDESCQGLCIIQSSCW